MTWNNEIRDFIASHLADDTARLLLSAHRYPDLDISFIVEQIEARRRLRTKLPEWYACPDLIMGGRIPAEQCSSEQTARFKRSILLPDSHSLCDMTGGMGVDFWYMTQGLDRAIYTERQPHLCAVASHNFAHLQTSSSSFPSILIREGLSTELPIPDVDVIYLDPARRSTDGSRIYEISDCEPDLVSWQHDLLSHCRQLITKVSPMADITRTLSRLVCVTDLYVVSHRAECKELLIVQRPESKEPITIHCIDLFPTHTLRFSYPLDASVSVQQTPASPSDLVYFYEPDVSLMKAQAFLPLLAHYPQLHQFDSDCHYFASREWIPDFPGRIFRIDEQLEFSSRLLKRLCSAIPQANIATRAFPLSADQLRSRTKIRDGGDVYLFGATLHAVGPILLCCRKISSV